MEENIIDITVEDRDGTCQIIKVPTDINMSLMEILKAAEYEVLATCGGMALCATCHIQIKEGLEHLKEPEDQELDMLDTLPNADADSRLACQIYLSNDNNGLSLQLKGALQ